MPASAQCRPVPETLGDKDAQPHRTGNQSFLGGGTVDFCPVVAGGLLSRAVDVVGLGVVIVLLVGGKGRGDEIAGAASRAQLAR